MGSYFEKHKKNISIPSAWNHSYSIDFIKYQKLDNIIISEIFLY